MIPVEMKEVLEIVLSEKGSKTVVQEVKDSKQEAAE